MHRREGLTRSQCADGALKRCRELAARTLSLIFPFQPTVCSVLSRRGTKCALKRTLGDFFAAEAALFGFAYSKILRAEARS